VGLGQKYNFGFTEKTAIRETNCYFGVSFLRNSNIFQYKKNSDFNVKTEKPKFKSRKNDQLLNDILNCS